MSESVVQITPWAVVRPFDAYDVPPFPVEALPPLLRTYSTAIAEATQTPLDLAAMLILSVLAAVNSKKFIARFSSDWVEPLNLYIAVALPPSSRKSAVFSECNKPLREYEADIIEATRADIAKERSRHTVFESQKTELEHKLAKESDSVKIATFQAQLDEIMEELIGHVVPALPRLIADDVTPEKLANLLCEQHGKIAVMAPEGGLFEGFTGRYSRGMPNIDVLLKAHCGDDLRVDRINRPPEFVNNPALTIGLAIQPEVLRGLISKPGLHGKGLLARFLYSLPTSNIGYRKISPAVMSNSIRLEYQQLIKRLLEISIDGEPRDLLLTKEAGTLFNAFRAQVEIQLTDFNAFGVIQDWAGKLPGAVLRIAANLHLANCVGRYPVPDIEIEMMEKAIKIGEYLAQHARCAYDLMGGNPQEELAKGILHCIRAKQWNIFTKREVHTALRGRIRSAQELDEPLRILVERGFIRNVVEGNHETGRPSRIYEVNPATVGTPTQNVQNQENLEYQPPESRVDEGQNASAELVDGNNSEMEIDPRILI